MITRRSLRETCLALGLAGTIGLVLGDCRCQAQTAETSMSLEQALQETQRTGRPTVAIAPGLFESMMRQRSVSDLVSSAQIVPLKASADPSPARGLGTLSAQEVRVYRRGAAAPELSARFGQARDAFEAIAWLRTKGLPTTETKPHSDLQIARASHLPHHGQDVRPSAQGTPTQAPALYTPAPAPALAVPVISAPATMVQAPATQPVVLQTPAPSIVVQQTPPTIYLAQPSQPANIQILAPAQSAPNVSVLQPAVSQPQQMFVSQPAQQNQPALNSPSPQSQAATFAPAQQQAASMSAPVIISAAPAQMATVTMAATQTQGAVQPAGLEVIPAGPIGRMIGQFGDRLSKHQYPRLRARTAPAVQPLSSPAVLTTAPQAAVQAPATSAPANYATPQQDHGWFHH